MVKIINKLFNSIYTHIVFYDLLIFITFFIVFSPNFLSGFFILGYYKSWLFLLGISSLISIPFGFISFILRNRKILWFIFLIIFVLLYFYFLLVIIDINKFIINPTPMLGGKDI